MLMTLNYNTTTYNSYATTKNAQYNNTNSNVRTIKQRWDDTFNNLPPYLQNTVSQALQNAIAEFRRRNPHIKKFSQLPLAESKDALMSSTSIDATMQRELDIFWSLELLNNFMPTMVVPIQVYRPDPSVDKFLAWDGQHTLVLLWLIATQIFGENPDKVIIPVNVYQSNLKAEMRANFISLNSKEGKKMLEAIDLWRQWIFGVRIDGSKNPLWVEAEKKQQYIENAGLFVTAKKFGDDKMPGAITRLQEINKLTPESVGHLCQYLVHATKLARPVEEKEMVMMAHFFDRCRVNRIEVTDSFIAEIARCTDMLWGSDFSPTGQFWVKASVAYHNWHARFSGSMYPGKFSKEPVHGFPFMIAQLSKTANVDELPLSDSRSEFWPLEEDLD